MNPNPTYQDPDPVIPPEATREALTLLARIRGRGVHDLDRQAFDALERARVEDGCHIQPEVAYNHGDVAAMTELPDEQRGWMGWLSPDRQLVIHTGNLRRYLMDARAAGTTLTDEMRADIIGMVGDIETAIAGIREMVA